MRVIIILMLFLASLNTVLGQNLKAYIQEALENNPQVQAFQWKYERAKEKHHEVNNIPNTQFGAAYFVSEPETRTGAQQFKLSAKQMLPWVGTITARENYANTMAEAEYEDISITKRQLVMSVTQSYYKLYAFQDKQNVLRDNIQLLKTYEALTLIAVEVSKVSVVDVLKLKVRLNALNERIQVLQQEFLAEQIAFNYLLNRKKEANVEVLDNIALPSKPLLVNTDLTVHPELVQYDKLFQSVEQLEILNQKENKPQIGLGLDYINVAERPGLSFDDNGKDIVMPMVFVSIPIFNKKYKSRTVQNTLRQQEIKAQKQSRKNKLAIILNRALKTQEASQISYNTLVKNLEQLHNAETILMKTYETGMIDFDEVLDVQELQLKFQIRQIDVIKEYYIQQAIVNYITS